MGRAKTIYYVGYDPGTGTSSMSITPVIVEEGASHQKMLATRRLSIPSLYGNGNFAKLINDRANRTNAELSSVVRKDEQEIAVGYGTSEFYIGELARLAGVNATNAKAAEKRYTNLYSRIVFLGLFGYLTDEDDIDNVEVEARVVTGLPISLFVPRTREAVKKNLGGSHTFSWNGHPRTVTVRVGTVTREGIKALATYGGDKRQGIIDIGTRTINVGQAIGQKVLPEYCKAEAIGVGKVLDRLIEVMKTEHRYAMPMSEAEAILKAYSAERALPTVLKGNAVIREQTILDIVNKSVSEEWTAIDLFIDQSWNEEGTDVGSNLQTIPCIGGGSKLWAKQLMAKFPQAMIPNRTEDEALTANVEAYLNLAIDLQEVDPNIWRVN